MRKSVTVDTGRLRAGAATLAKADSAPSLTVFHHGDLGSSRSDAAFEEFAHYWTSGRSLLERSADALAGVLRSAAETYHQRDEDDSARFWGF